MVNEKRDHIPPIPLDGKPSLFPVEVNLSRRRLLSRHVCHSLVSSVLQFQFVPRSDDKGSLLNWKQVLRDGPPMLMKHG